MCSTLLRVFCCLTIAVSVAGAQDLSSPEDKESYAVGVQLGNFVNNGIDILDLELVIQGIRDVCAEKDLPLDEAEVQAAFMQAQKKLQAAAQAKMAEAGAENKAEGQAWLAENATKEGVQTTASGLQYKVITEGTGASPTQADSVTTNYRGTLIDGTQFDSSYDRGEPATFPVTGVIAGWTEALQLMKVGGKWELYIPYDLAYGEQGRPPVIPPASTLIFEIELLEIAE